MTTRTMCLASGFLDSLSASETVARRSRTDRDDRVFICMIVLVLWRIGSEFRAYVRTLGAQPAQSLRRYNTRSVIPRKNIPLFINYSLQALDLSLGRMRPRLGNVLGARPAQQHRTTALRLSQNGNDCTLITNNEITGKSNLNTGSTFVLDGKDRRMRRCIVARCKSVKLFCFITTTYKKFYSVTI